MKYETNIDAFKAFAQKNNWLLVSSDLKRFDRFNENNWVTPSGNIVHLSWNDQGIRHIYNYGHSYGTDELHC
jgi:hypothetical protein